GRLKAFFTKEKIHAFLIHLGISLIIFSILLYFILVEWYPQPLFANDGGWQGIRLIAFVDIVLGPFLTLIVYKKGKPRLKLDLAIIAVIQISALVSGIIVVYNEHPIAVVILNNRLYPITAAQVKKAEIEKTSLYQYSDLRPPLIFVKTPNDLSKLVDVISKSFRDGRELRLHGEFYEKLSSENKVLLRQGALSIDEFIDNKPNNNKIYQQFLKGSHYENNSILYFPIYSRYVFGIAVLDNDTFEILEILDIYPPNFGDKTP
ncbi:MAG: hypothetical protein ACC656_04605, partial [Candidatus Heimdallarchaeota archaeon]